jgi:hypothetical protein
MQKIEQLEQLEQLEQQEQKVRAKQKQQDDVWASIEADCADLGLVSDDELRERAALKADLDRVYALYARAPRDQFEDARRRLFLLVDRVIRLGGTRTPA